MSRIVTAAAVVLATIGGVTMGAFGRPAETGEDRVPERLSETGLYVVGRPGVVAPETRYFSPQYPLWTDGAYKTRWVYLPPGSAIDASDPNDWDVPVGTRFWKEFAFHGRKVETRMIWRASRDRWVFATYVWNEEQTDAQLAPQDGVARVVPLSATRQHSVPSVNDCAACHGTARPGPLGFNALQLSPDRDPNAIHGEPPGPDMLTLGTLLGEGRLSNAPAGAFSEAPRIHTNNPRTRAALGYLVANCGSCHNGRGEIAALGPVLKYDELLTNADAVAQGLVNQRTRWQVPALAEGTSVVVSDASPDRSALLVRMRSRSPSSQMPPLGTVLRDGEALQRLTEWISLDLARQSHR
jgi:mono/diheme cytochrome c family protein